MRNYWSCVCVCIEVRDWCWAHESFYSPRWGLGVLRPGGLRMSVERRYVMNDMILCSVPNCLSQ